VEYLLCRRDTNIAAKGDDGHTAFELACFRGHLEVAKLLVAAGARVNPQHGKRWGPLGLAAFGGQLQVVKYLVEQAGADVRWAYPDGSTPLKMADFRGHADVAEYLRRAIAQREYEVCVALLLQVHVNNRLM
jgi:ankyrin repeat protein